MHAIILRYLRGATARSIGQIFTLWVPKGAPFGGNGGILPRLLLNVHPLALAEDPAPPPACWPEPGHPNLRVRNQQPNDHEGAIKGGDHSTSGKWSLDMGLIPHEALLFIIKEFPRPLSAAE